MPITVIDEDVDPALFTWVGPTREEADRFVTPARRDYEEEGARPR
ncbi:hypothetical protein [Rhodococcus pseudokoreensis]|nr:hypothetical protein [Rhodococcus pseudokoreensis]